MWINNNKQTQGELMGSFHFLYYFGEPCLFFCIFKPLLFSNSCILIYYLIFYMFTQLILSLSSSLFFCLWITFFRSVSIRFPSVEIDSQNWNLLERGHTDMSVTSAFIFVSVALLLYGNAEQTLHISEPHCHAAMTLTLTTIKGDMSFTMIDYLNQKSIKCLKLIFIP